MEFSIISGHTVHVILTVYIHSACNITTVTACDITTVTEYAKHEMSLLEQCDVRNVTIFYAA